MKYYSSIHLNLSIQTQCKYFYDNITSVMEDWIFWPWSYLLGFYAIISDSIKKKLQWGGRIFYFEKKRLYCFTITMREYFYHNLKQFLLYYIVCFSLRCGERLCRRNEVNLCQCPMWFIDEMVRLFLYISDNLYSHFYHCTYIVIYTTDHIPKYKLIYQTLKTKTVQIYSVSMV